MGRPSTHARPTTSPSAPPAHNRLPPPTVEPGCAHGSLPAHALLASTNDREASLPDHALPPTSRPCGRQTAPWLLMFDCPPSPSRQSRPPPEDPTMPTNTPEPPNPSMPRVLDGPEPGGVPEAEAETSLRGWFPRPEVGPEDG